MDQDYLGTAFGADGGGASGRSGSAAFADQIFAFAPAERTAAAPTPGTGHGPVSGDSGTGATTSRVFASGDRFIDGITLYDKWAPNITYSFPSTNTQYNYSNSGSQRQLDNYHMMNRFAPVTQDVRDAAHFALSQYLTQDGAEGLAVGGFTNLEVLFNPVGGVANIRFAESTSYTVPTAKVADFPGNYNTSQLMDNGDVWFGTAYVSDPTLNLRTPEAGNYAWATTLHEIGHALGLKHAHADGRMSMEARYDTMEYTIMSYRSYVGADTDAGYRNAQWDFAQTFMMADIAALQYMYGANYTVNNGDTVYKWNPNSGDTLVNGDVAIDAGGSKILATLWDGGGTDTYDLRSYTTAVTVNLAPGEYSVFSSTQLADLGDGNTARANIFNARLFQGNTASLIENAWGGSGNDSLQGNQVANTLLGNGGNDRLFGQDGDDGLSGGVGDDVLYGGMGDDSLLGDSGNDSAYGGAGDDNINGGVGNDVGYGGAGHDTLLDAAGTNTLYGGTGNDTLWVFTGHTGTTLVEYAGEGTDTLEVYDTGTGGTIYDLANYANIENMTFSASGSRGFTGYGDSGANRLQANDAGNTLSGREGDDTLRGGDGSDVLQGGVGNDVMVGQGGDDHIFVDSLDDDVYEFAGDGIDTIYSYITWDLVQRGDAYEEFEILRLRGTDDINGTGNALDNDISGNSGFNVLRGRDGDDLLRGLVGDDALLGGSGNDTLIAGSGSNTMDGGTGADSMTGGDGDDSYQVDNIGDQIFEQLGEGYDTVYASITWDLVQRADSTERLEALRLGGSADIDGFGNVQDNYLSGNEGSNTLEGRDGNDTLDGNDGDDFLYGGAGNDRLNGGAGHDVLSGSQGSNIMNGGGGRDSLYGADGDDVMNGGANRDLLQGGDGNDSMKGAVGDDMIFGEDGNDTIDGGTGNDTVNGGSGNDMVNGGTGRDDIKGGGGRDTLNGGSDDDLLNGGGGGDTMTGGSGNDSLRGGGGRDIMDGGTGDDILNAGSKDDRLTGGTGEDKLVGAGGNDMLSGGLGNDRLEGGTGNDTMNGNAGRDRLVGGTGADSFEFNRAGGKDIITDFEDDIDQIALDEALWSGSKTVAEVLSDHANVFNGDVILNFGTGAKLVVENITDISALADDIVFL